MNKYLIIGLLIIATLTIAVFLVFLKNQQIQSLKKDSTSQTTVNPPQELPDYTEPTTGRKIERTINLSTGDTAQVIMPEEMGDVDPDVIEKIIFRSK